MNGNSLVHTCCRGCRKHDCRCYWTPVHSSHRVLSPHQEDLKSFHLRLCARRGAHTEGHWAGRFHGTDIFGVEVIKVILNQSDRKNGPKKPAINRVKQCHTLCSTRRGCKTDLRRESVRGESRGVGYKEPDSGLDLTRASPDTHSLDISLKHVTRLVGRNLGWDELVIILGLLRFPIGWMKSNAVGKYGRTGIWWKSRCL